MVNSETIFSISSESEFQEIALEVFRYQAINIPVYRDFLSLLKIKPENISNYQQIPFLPVEFFKSHEIIAESKEPEIVFESSTTTGSVPSKHFVASIDLYIESFIKGFGKFYGNPADYCILALLPSYLERKGSSLVFMANELIHQSKHVESGFYLDEHEKLITLLKKLQKAGKPCILIGVTYALLDLADRFKESLSDIIIMETGGMKGRRKEMVRDDLHSYLKSSFDLKSVHSEYGMTELLSQAYSKGEGRFYCPPWMKILIRDSYDPLQILTTGSTGGINIIDLANLYSCSFIASSDLGRLNDDSSFEVLGRIDNSDIRGCNLMIG